MALPITTIAAFADELEKIADDTIQNSEELKKVLKPGDILLTKPRKLKGIHHKILRPLLKAFQGGSEYTHAALYAGDDKVIDSGLWKGKAKVTAIPLSTYTDRYKFKILRVSDAAKKETRDAVDYAKEQIGKPFSILKMMRLALPTGSTTEPRKRQELDKLFCSELIANAYHRQNFAAHKKIQHVRPVDLHKSPLTKTVAEFE